MDPLIENLKSTTFFGKRLTRRQIADIQETVGLFPKLSRTELGHTICEHLRWQTPKGSNRIHLATRLLEELERLGILTLPARSAMPVLYFTLFRQNSSDYSDARPRNFVD